MLEQRGLRSSYYWMTTQSSHFTIGLFVVRDTTKAYSWTILACNMLMIGESHGSLIISEVVAELVVISRVLDHVGAAHVVLFL